MMIQGITSSDLVSSYIERFHPGKTLLVIYVMDRNSCSSILADLKTDLDVYVPNRVEQYSDYVLIGARREELVKFIKDHSYTLYHTRLELYIGGCLYMHN